jgi:hypothetical protein
MRGVKKNNNNLKLHLQHVFKLIMKTNFTVCESVCNDVRFIST